MTQSKHKPATTNPRQLNLVHSKRLQSLTSASSRIDQAKHAEIAATTLQDDPNAAYLLCQIQQRIAEILAQLPEGKHRSLFKIRFGVSLDELEKMSFQQAAAILKIGFKRH